MKQETSEIVLNAHRLLVDLESITVKDNQNNSIGNFSAELCLAALKLLNPFYRSFHHGGYERL